MTQKNLGALGRAPGGTLTNQPSVEFELVLGRDAHPQGGRPAVNRESPGPDPLLGFAARSESELR